MRCFRYGDLQTAFPTLDGLVLAANGVTFDVAAGETLAIVGESGSGKSVTCRSLIGLVPKPGEVIGGQAIFAGRDLLQLSEKDLRAVRGGDIGMIFQDPTSSLNPVYRVGAQVVEVLQVKLGMKRREAAARAIELLDRVGIASPETRFNAYPHELSGGMRQRAMIATAIATQPKLLIADEPTTALDVTVQTQIMALLTDLQKDTGLAMILVSHDFGVVAQHCDVVAVMYAGYVVEYAPVHDIFENPQHPYTRALLSSIPKLEAGQAQDLIPVQGQPPELSQLPSGCPFAPRCEIVRTECTSVTMTLESTRPHHLSACPFAGDLAGSMHSLGPT